jgi:hypothetical protein
MTPEILSAIEWAYNVLTWSIFTYNSTKKTPVSMLGLIVRIDDRLQNYRRDILLQYKTLMKLADNADDVKQINPTNQEERGPSKPGSRKGSPPGRLLRDEEGDSKGKTKLKSLKQTSKNVETKVQPSGPNKARKILESESRHIVFTSDVSEDDAS